LSEEAVSQALVSCVFEKIRGQIDQLRHLAGLAHDIPVDWTPDLPGALAMGSLFGHLLDAVSGFCAVLHAALPAKLAHFSELRRLPVNELCTPSEFAARLTIYQQCLSEGAGLLQDFDLSRRVPSIFARDGELILSLLIANMEHVVSHKYQLFVYLKAAGIAVSTQDLYRISSRLNSNGEILPL
jgi:hypothetical protein